MMDGQSHRAGGPRPPGSAAGACLRWILAGGLLLGLPSLPAEAAAGDTGPALLAEGRAALEDELFDLAQARIERARATGALSPADALESSILLARALHGRQRYAELLALLAADRARAKGTAQADAFDFWTALAHFELGRYEQALSCLGNFAAAYPASPYQPRALRLQAWSFLKLGRQDEAIACFTRFAERYGSSPEGPANLLDGARALLAAGNRATAREVLGTLVALDLDDRIGQEGRSLLGRLYVSEQKWDQARRTVRPLVERKNVPAELRTAAYFCLADVAEAQSNLVEALSLLDRGADQVSDPAARQELDLRRGRLLLNMGKIDEGANLVRGYVAAQSARAAAREVHLQLADFLLARGLHDKALREFQNYLETFSDPAGVFKAHFGKGWALLGLGRSAEAAASFDRAAAAAGSPAEKAFCRFKAADCQFAGEQFKLAAESYARVAAQCPGNDLAEQALLQVAECRARLGSLEEAERLFWDVADLDAGGPLGARALLRVAELRQQQGADAEARALYGLVLAEAPADARARARLGVAFLDYRLGRFAEALDGFQAVERDQTRSEVADLALYMSGWCLVRLARPEPAAETFRDLLRRFPRSDWAADALFWLAEQDFNRGRYELAESAWTSLAAEYPRAAAADKALFWAGRAALRRNEFRRAKDHFSLLIKQYPSSELRAEARFFQGQALAELGEFAGVILIMDEILKQFPEGELALAAWLRKGDSQFTLGADDPRRYEEAIKSYQQVLDLPTSDPLTKLQAQYKTGRCLEKAGRPAEAFEHYMKAVYSYFKHPEVKPRGDVWLTRAAFSAAGLKEDEKSWRKAAAIYQRVLDAGVPAAPDAQRRIEQIRADYWMYFY